jgi:hypothetical protein
VKIGRLVTSANPTAIGAADGEAAYLTHSSTNPSTLNVYPVVKALESIGSHELWAVGRG